MFTDVAAAASSRSVSRLETAFLCWWWWLLKLRWWPLKGHSAIIANFSQVTWCLMHLLPRRKLPVSSNNLERKKKSNRAWVICIQRELWQALLCTPQTITNNLWYTSEKVVILHMMESFFAHVLSKKVLKNKAWTILTIFWQMSETSPSVCRLLKCYSTDLRVSNSFARVHE